MASKFTDRRVAAENGSTRYFTGRPCKHGHIAERFTTSGGCVECVNVTVVKKAFSAPNVAMPPTPYAFRSDIPLTPELVSYVHGRVLQMVNGLAEEFLATISRVQVHEHQQAHNTVAAVMNATQGVRGPQVAQCPDGYRLTPKAGAAPYATFAAAGWTVDTLVAEGYMERVP
jgi:hypothetical protein